jgi:hypothetical protein
MNPSELPDSKNKFEKNAYFIGEVALIIACLGALNYLITPIIRAHQHVDFQPGDQIIYIDPGNVAITSHEEHVYVTLPPDRYAELNWDSVIAENDPHRKNAAKNATKILNGSGFGGNPKGLQINLTKKEDGDLSLGIFSGYELTEAELKLAVQNAEYSRRLTPEDIKQLAKKVLLYTGAAVGTTSVLGTMSWIARRRKFSTKKAKRQANSRRKNDQMDQSSQQMQVLKRGGSLLDEPHSNTNLQITSEFASQYVKENMPWLSGVETNDEAGRQKSIEQTKKVALLVADRNHRATENEIAKRYSPLTKLLNTANAMRHLSGSWQADEIDPEADEFPLPKKTKP